MKFPYRKLFLRDRKTGEIDLFLRPEAPITIHGQSCSMTCTGLVDSGSDTTVIPASLGRELGVTLMPSRRQGSGFGGHVLDFFTPFARLHPGGSASHGRRWPVLLLCGEVAGDLAGWRCVACAMSTMFAPGIGRRAWRTLQDGMIFPPCGGRCRH